MNDGDPNDLAAMFWRDALEEPANASMLDEASCRQLADNIPTLCWIADGDGYITWYNRRWYDYTGTTPEQMKGWGWQSVHDPEVLPAVMERWTAAIGTGKAFEMTFPLRGADGQYRPFQTRICPMRSADGLVARWFGANAEVSDQIRAAQLLEEANERFQAAVRATHGVLWTNTPEGEMRGEQSGWAHLTGQSYDEYQGYGWADAVHPEDAQPTIKAWNEAVRSRSTFKFEHRVRRHDGVWRRFSIRAIPVIDNADAIREWVGVHTDITEQRDVEDALRAMNETLESRVSEVAADLDRVWRNASDIFVVIDGEGLLHRVNPATTAILGWSEAELVGRSVFDLIHPEDVPLSLGALEHARTQVLPTFENRYRTKDGGLRTISWVAAPEGEWIYAYGRDVSAERAQQADLAVAQEALRQSQKMEAIGQLTGGVAHDFNNLLTVIRSAVDLLRLPDLSEEKRGRYINAISDTADRAAKLTGQLLAFARRQALNAETLDVGRSISAIGEVIGTLIGSRIRYSTTLPDAACHIFADSNQFDTAIVNMVANARDAMQSGGVLTITVAPVSSIPALRSHPEVHGEFVAISISDTGTGIPADQVERVFEPFFTTKGVGKGTGLGLSQVFGFAKQSGGEVLVKSEVGVGTTFTLYLPHVEGVDRHGAGEANMSPLPDGHATCVLVVEDNADVGEFATRSLGELGYHSVLAPNAEQALAELDRGGRRFDIIFSDVVMPGMSGIDLAREIRDRYPDLPIVLTSGYSHVLAQNGTHGFELLHKPYSVDQLSRTLWKVLEQGRRGSAVS
ncbi:hybrid sensor histidine kinase/response regulator [Sphingomonas adhaesiva]|uniref:histidine kinase n=1 Tax=Sphingomonas adhaesiva TaxID=28212 RepID=A0A2A4I496_9SPHN|nr:PAS domain-containing sensor histidine kinase [Sphingomonas adhaesiva]PCG13295.1 PAS domain-containing sensor histidine kinase [Sphingomonas adhaesiva]